MPNIWPYSFQSRFLLETGYYPDATYSSDNVVLARSLQELGVQAIIPASSSIGSRMGLSNSLHLSFISEQATVPMIIDTGINSPADANLAMMLKRPYASANSPERISI